MRSSVHKPLPVSIYGLLWQQTILLQVAVIGLGLLLPALVVIPLELQRRVVDDAIPEGDVAMLLWLAVFYTGTAAAAAAIKFAIHFLRGVIEARMTRYLRDRALDAQRRRPPVAAQAALGPVTSIIAEEAYPLGGFAAQAINTPLIEGAAMLGVAGFMFVTEPWLAAIGIGAMAVQTTLVPLVQRHVNRLALRRVNAVRRTNATIIGASRPDSPVRFRDAMADIRLAYQLRLRMNLLKAGLKAGLKLADNLTTILLLGVGGLFVMQGETTMGVIVAFLSGLKRLRDPWESLVTFYREFADARVKYRLVTAAMATTVVIEADPEAPARHDHAMA